MADVVKTLEIPDMTALVGEPRDRGWLDDVAIRARAADTLAAGITRELWKYTPIQGFLDGLAGTSAARPCALTFSGVDQPGVRAVPLAELSSDEQARLRQTIGEQIDSRRHPLTDLALLRAGGGWLIDVSGEPAEPVEIRYPRQGLAPVFVRLASNARLTLVEHLHSSGLPDSGFLAQVAHVELAPGAHLDQHRAALDKDLGHYAALLVRVGQDASYRLNHTMVGGRRRRSEVHVVMAGPGARADMQGAYLVEEGQHLDQQFVVEHSAGHTVSRQKFHGIGAGRGKSVFHGRIHIHPGANGSDAALSNRNLALHPDAEMNTKPELEIYTDDVRCAHGATVGQMAADSLFFLTARGIPEPAARRMLAHGFVRECMSGPTADAAAERFALALT